jgi:hypothetical protein
MPKLSTNTFVLSKTNNTGPIASGYDLYEGVTNFTPLKLNARATFDVIGSSGGSQVAINEFTIADLLPICVSLLTTRLDILLIPTLRIRTDSRVIY